MIVDCDDIFSYVVQYVISLQLLEFLSCIQSIILLAKLKWKITNKLNLAL